MKNRPSNNPLSVQYKTSKIWTVSVVEIQIEKKHQELLYLKKYVWKAKNLCRYQIPFKINPGGCFFLSISANCMNCLNCSNTRLSNNANTDLPRRQQSDRQISPIITITYRFPLINQTFIAIKTNFCFIGIRLIFCSSWEQLSLSEI